MTDEQPSLDLGIDAARSRRSTPAVANLANRPWPLSDLLRAAEVDVATLADILGVDQTTVWRRKEWGLTDEEADHWATACRIHPSDAWGWPWTEAGLGGPEQGDLFE